MAEGKSWRSTATLQHSKRRPPPHIRRQQRIDQGLPVRDDQPEGAPLPEEAAPGGSSSSAQPAAKAWPPPPPPAPRRDRRLALCGQPNPAHPSAKEEASGSRVRCGFAFGSEEARSSRDLPNQQARPRPPQRQGPAGPPVDPAHEEESFWGRRQRMRREAQDFTPGVHAAGEAASYIKRPTSPRHFLPPELTLTAGCGGSPSSPALGLGTKPCRLPAVSGVGLEAHG